MRRPRSSARRCRPPQADARAERDEALRELDRSARDGELGPAGERLARLVHHGESSWLDVLHGRDASPEAEAVRQDRAGDLEAAVERLAEQDPELAQQLGRNDQTDPPDDAGDSGDSGADWRP